MRLILALLFIVIALRLLLRVVRRIVQPSLTDPAVSAYAGRCVSERSYAELCSGSEELYGYDGRELLATVEACPVRGLPTGMLFRFSVYPGAARFGRPSRAWIFVRSEEHLAWVKEAHASLIAAEKGLQASLELAAHETRAVSRTAAEAEGRGPSAETLDEAVA